LMSCSMLMSVLACMIVHELQLDMLNWQPSYPCERTGSPGGLSGLPAQS
jgi:hypothetical protein